MAGFRDFQTGEVLTAANVNDFLAKQSVMKFADAAARDTALGTAVGGGNALREGMVAYLDSTDEVLKYDGTAWDTVAPVVQGIGSAVVQTVKTNTYTAAVGTAYTDIPDLSVSITPSSATSKILVISYIVCASSTNNQAGLSLRLVRDSTDIFLGTAASNRRQATYGPSGPASSSNRGVVPVSFSFVDSPATASQVTYKVQIATNSGGTVYVNRSEGDVDLAGFDRPPSALMAIEVAA